TFQFAKKFDWLTLRYGLKESTGGIGVDGEWFDDRLKLSIDAFEATWAGLPRLKVTAAYRMFGFLYLLGGVDDALISPTEIPVTDVGLPEGVPTHLSSFRYGRDVFFGAQLKFNDRDLSSLLFIGGAAIAGLAD